MTGRPPFIGESFTATLQQGATMDPVAPRLLNPSIPRDLEAISLKCLEKDPGNRYQTAQELANELERWQGDEPILARPVSSMERLWRWTTLAAAVGSALLLAVGCAIGATALVFKTREAQQARVASALQAIHSHVEKSRALRKSTRAGRRYEALAGLKAARDFSPGPELVDEILDEAIACLALPDIRVGKSWGIDQLNFDGCVRFNADQSLYAQIIGTQGVLVRRVKDGAEVARLAIDKETPKWLTCFSPDNRYLIATVPSGESVVWDIAQRSVRTRIPAHTTFAFMPEGRRLAISKADKTYVLMDCDAFDVQIRIPIERHFAALVFRDDGSSFLGTEWDSDTVEWRSASTGDLPGTFVAVHPVSAMALSKDGTKIAAGTTYGQLTVWNAKSGKQHSPPSCMRV